MINKIAILLIIIGYASCKPSSKEFSELEVAKEYYSLLDHSDAEGMTKLIGDSIVIRETEDEYQEVFSREGYSTWVKWDEVFEPSYKVLEIKHVDKVVKAKVSKIDKRLTFLHEEPMVWEEVVAFKDGMIVKVERINYEVFNVPRFLANRQKLVSWIEESHPELTGFLYDQTAKGGLNYLKAMRLYDDNFNAK